MGVSWGIDGLLGASDGAWAGWPHRHQNHPPTTNFSVWNDARQCKTLARWVCGSPSKKKYPGVNNKYLCAKKLTNPKWKKQSNNNAHQQLHEVHTKFQKFKFTAFKTTCCIFYCTASRSTFSIGERGQLEVKDEKENKPLVDRVTIVVEVYGVVCLLYWRLWNTTLAT